MDTFEVLASEDAAEQERLSGTRAVIAAQTRAKEQFGAFVAKAATDEERDARIALISSDLEAMLSDVASEYSYSDTDRLSKAATVALGAGHPADCTCGFCENKGSFGKDEKEKDADGDYDGDEDDDMDKESSVKEANKYIEERDGKWVVTQKGTGKVLSTHDSKEDAEASFRAMEMHKHEGALDIPPRVLPEFPWDSFQPIAADVETGDSYQSERVDLGESKDGVSDVGSPKIDKSKSGDETGWDLKPIDVNSERHQLEHQDATDRADYTAGDFDPQNSVTDRIDADKPLQPEHNVGDSTETWTGTEGLASPVTSAVVAKWSVLT